MGFKRDREKERLKKHKRDKKIARTRKWVTSVPFSFDGISQLAMGHLRRIIDNPKAFEQYPGLHQMATDALVERKLQLERH